MIKFTSCLPRVGDSLQVLRLLPPLKRVAMILLKVALNTNIQIPINQSKPYQWSNTVNSVLALSAVIWVEPLSDQTKDYKIGICSSAKYASLTSKNKDWLAWNRDTVSEWRDMSTNELLLQSANIKSY